MCVDTVAQNVNHWRRIHKVTAQLALGRFNRGIRGGGISPGLEQAASTSNFTSKMAEQDRSRRLHQQSGRIIRPGYTIWVYRCES